MLNRLSATVLYQVSSNLCDQQDVLALAATCKTARQVLEDDRIGTSWHGVAQKEGIDQKLLRQAVSEFGSAEQFLQYRTKKEAFHTELRFVCAPTFSSYEALQESPYFFQKSTLWLIFEEERRSIDQGRRSIYSVHSNHQSVMSTLQRMKLCFWSRDLSFSHLHPLLAQNKNVAQQNALLLIQRLELATQQYFERTRYTPYGETWNHTSRCWQNPPKYSFRDLLPKLGPFS